MAKKNYVRVDAGNFTLNYKTADTCTLEVDGVNKNGTSVKIHIVLDDYQFPGIIQQMAAMGRRRLKTAITRNDDIKNAINPNQ